MIRWPSEHKMKQKQGPPTSTMIVELLCVKLDDKIKEVTGKDKVKKWHIMCTNALGRNSAML